MERVRAQSVPVKTTPVGWSDNTFNILAILKKYNPYANLSEQDKTELNRVRAIPEKRDYFHWVGRRHVYCEPEYVPDEPAFPIYY
jgi:hypothetical protein